MKVIAPGDVEIDLGTVETTPTVGINDFSRRVTDDFGTTTIVKRGYARRMSVRFALPFDEVDEVQRTLADLRATPVQWIADEDYSWLNFEGIFKDFDIDLALPPLSYCTLTVEGLTETETVPDAGEDPAPDDDASTLLLLHPVTVAGAALVSSNVPETDWPEWSNVTVYPVGARVIKAATHRIYESVAATNVANDPAGLSGKWIDVGPTNRWAMFDEALGTITSRATSIAVTIDAGAVDALALLDVVGATVRVQTTGYDQTKAVTPGALTFLDLPGIDANVTVTITGTGTVSAGTLLIGTLMKLGITAESPTAGITDYSRKDVDEFGEVTIVERAWAKRMTARALIARDALDLVANRIAAMRGRPALWIADDGTDSLTIHGFFKDFSIEVGERVSTLSLTVEGLSEAMPIVEDFDGRSIIEKDIYKRSASAPPTPTGGSFDFETMVTTVPAGWSASVPAGTDPVYISSAIASKEGPGGSADFGAWSPPVIAFAHGADGAPGAPGAPGTAGAPGATGAPGAPGAPGATLYTWYAYADAPDGTFNFSTGVPGGRQYQGVAYNKTTATESTNPADYAWSDYIGPPNFGLTSFNGNTVIAGNKLIKVAGGGDWNASVHSTESFKGGASVSFVVDAGPYSFMVGLNTDPTTDASYTGLDFAIYIAGTTVQIYESGVFKHERLAFSALGDVWTVTYNGKSVVYSKNGVPFFANSSPAADLTLYLDTSILTFGATVGRILSFSGVGTAGVDAWTPVAGGGVTREGSKFAFNTTYSNPNYNGFVYSAEKGAGATLSFTVDQAMMLVVASLNSDPESTTNYDGQDYMLYFHNFGSGGTQDIRPHISGVDQGAFGTYSPGDRFTMRHTGAKIDCFKNNATTPFFTFNGVSPTARLALDIRGREAGKSVSNVTLSFAGSDGISPVNAVAVPANKQFAAESDGTIKNAGSVLPFNVAIDATKAGATISGAVTILAVSGCTATAISGGFTIDSVFADAGFVSWRFTASDGQIVENKMSFSRQLDPVSGGQILFPFSSTSWWGSGSYAATGPSTVLPASSTGKLAIQGYATFYCSGNGQAYLSAKMQYRAVGSGTWIDSGFTSGPSVAIKTADFPGEPGENSPGEVSPGGTLTGLTANGSYEVQMVGLRNASFNAIASATGRITLRQVA